MSYAVKSRQYVASPLEAIFSLYFALATQRKALIYCRFKLTNQILHRDFLT